MSDLEPLILTTMAKNSLFWGKASGKLGEVVLYRTGGEQRSRTYIKNIKNPKSLAQMEQRIKMASLVGFFKSLRSVLRFSFPMKKGNQSGFNAFMAASLPNATTAISKTAADNGLSVPLDYAVSRGDILLPAGAMVAPVYSEAAQSPLAGGLQFLPSGSGAGNEVEGYDIPSAQTLAEAMEGYLLYYPELAAQLPLKFNLVVVSSSYVDEGFKQESTIFKFDRSGGTMEVEMPSMLTFRSGVFPVLIGSMAAAKSIIVGGVMTNEDNGASMVAAFLSYTGDDGKLHVSNANMKVAHDGSAYVEQFQKGGDVYNQYLEDLGYTDGSSIGTR